MDQCPRCWLEMGLQAGMRARHDTPCRPGRSFSANLEPSTRLELLFGGKSLATGRTRARGSQTGCLTRLTNQLGRTAGWETIMVLKRSSVGRHGVGVTAPGDSRLDRMVAIKAGTSELASLANDFSRPLRGGKARTLAQLHHPNYRRSTTFRPPFSVNGMANKEKTSRTRCKADLLDLDEALAKPVCRLGAASKGRGPRGADILQP